MTDQPATDHARAAKEAADVAASADADPADAIRFLAMAVGQIAVAVDKVASDAERSRQVADQLAAIVERLSAVQLPPGVSGMLGIDPPTELVGNGQ